MTTVIELNSIPYFKNSATIERLKEHFRLHSDFMVHQLAVATGCTVEEALAVCLLFYHYRQAEIYILLYQKDLEINPVCAVKLSEGLPKTPFYNEDNDKEIDSLDNVTYSFWFVLSPNSEFEIIA